MKTERKEKSEGKAVTDRWRDGPGQAHPSAQLTSLSTSPFLIFKKRNKNNTYLDRVVVRLK